jgi:two-component system, OmpR family, sensor histidine kinase ChvG
MSEGRRGSRVGWTSRVSLRWRILALNIFAVALLAGGFFYLDSYRSRLVERERAALESDARLLADLLPAQMDEPGRAAILNYARANQARVRLYNAGGQRYFDSFSIAPPTYALRDPSTQPWQRHAARTMDRTIDWLVGARIPPAVAEPEVDQAAAWPELATAQRRGRATSAYRFAPDRTPFLTAATSIPDGRGAMLISTNARRITTTVRAERLDWLLVLGATLIISVLLSRFMARTIAEPLRTLSLAALRVRLGRARDVIVPRLPERRDEIGQLARAVSDMTSALRDRIDAGEQFAADVTHELKNPLASLRSALDTLDRVTDPAIQAQLLGIAREDVQRLDRLITDIAEASRLDAQLTRTQFEPVDLGELIEGIIGDRKRRHIEATPTIAFARPHVGSAMVAGVRSQLARVFENLIDNALSFSPASGVVRIAATCAGQLVIVRIDDDGPGIAANQREDIFRRFHSLRTDDQAAFGKHSGLGLAIARTIIEAHDGSIVAEDREDGARGASFVIRLPSNANAD